MNKRWRTFEDSRANPARVADVLEEVRVLLHPGNIEGCKWWINTGLEMHV